MSNEEYTTKGLRHHIVAGARDILVVSAVTSLLFTVAAFSTRHVWEPFANLPTELAEVQIQLLETRRELNVISGSFRETQEYHIVDFDGPGQVQTGDGITPGSTINVLYFLRRNANCSTRLEPRFYNVDTNTYFVAESRFAVRAPVTETFGLFTVPVPIPRDIPPGRYVYAPLLEAVDCGVYRSQQVPPSTIFEVSP
jgi:hypothetical protein